MVKLFKAGVRIRHLQIATKVVTYARHSCVMTQATLKPVALLLHGCKSCSKLKESGWHPDKDYLTIETGLLSQSGALAICET